MKIACNKFAGLSNDLNDNGTVSSKRDVVMIDERPYSKYVLVGLVKNYEYATCVFNGK